MKLTLLSEYQFCPRVPRARTFASSRPLPPQSVSHKILQQGQTIARHTHDRTPQDKVRASQGKSGQVGARQGKSGQGKARQGKAGQSRANRGKSGQVGASRSKSGQVGARKAFFEKPKSCVKPLNKKVAPHGTPGHSWPLLPLMALLATHGPSWPRMAKHRHVKANSRI